MTNRMLFPIRPSPPDDRDHIFEHKSRSRDVVSKLPSECDLRKYLNPPRTQGNRPTCAAFASCAIKEYHEYLDCNYQGYFSPNYVYFYRDNSPGEGMYLRDVMKVLYNRGIVKESDFPYSSTSEPSAVPDGSDEKAKAFRIKEYALVNTIDGLKEALITNGPCIISFPVYDNRPEFWRVDQDSTVQGGHAVAVVGFNKNGFILRNSWGRSWNFDGYAIYPYSEWGVHWECWTSVDDESNHQFQNESAFKKIIRYLNCCQ